MLRANTPIRPPVESSRPARSRQARPGEDLRHDSMGRVEEEQWSAMTIKGSEHFIRK